MKKILGIIAFCLTFPAYAAQPQLVFPAACELGKTCYIQLYVDVAAAPNTKDSGVPTPKDVSGNHLTNSNHTGTDIALATYQQMNAGVNVLAADAGKVVRLRNDQEDHLNRDYQYDPKKACGNGIIIDHGKGWQTQYCHLKKGSIIVKAGDKVQAGQAIAQIGASGHADFPHLHFTVRHNDNAEDPFSKHLWKNNIQYTSTGLIDWGLADKALKLQDVLNQPPRRVQFSLYDSAFVLWVRVFGVQTGDEQRITFYQPDGKVYQKPIQTTIPASYKEWFTYAGYPLSDKIPADLSGKWHVDFQIKRGNADWQTLGQLDFTVSS